MKKLISLFVATLMIVGVLPLAVFAAADADVQAVYDALTSEMLTTDNEPDYSVTKNLDLDLSDDLTIPEGVSVTFSSNDVSAIANDGTVVRDANETKNVTFTASISKDGSDTLTKEFAFSVLPLTSEVVASDNLYYPEHANKVLVSYETGSAVKTVSDWTLSSLSKTIVDSHFDAKFLKDNKGYYNATGTRLAGTNECYIQYAPTSVPDVVQSANDRFVTYKIGFNPVSWGSTSTKQFYLRIYGQSGGSSKMIAYVQMWSDKTRLVTPDTTATEYVKSTDAVKLNQDNTLELKIDYNAKLYYFTLNGKLINPNGTVIPDVTYTKQFSHLSFGYYREMKDSVMQINDIAITKQTPYKVNSVNDITAEILADGQVPNFITEDLNLPANSEFTWTSNKPDVISSSGTVARPTAEDEVVTLTATSGDVSKSVEFTVKALTVSRVGANLSFIEPYFDWTLNGANCSLFTDASSADVKYASDNTDYYIDYTATASYDNSKVVYSIPTTDFAVGSSGKYVFEFDACYTNTAHAMFSFLGDDSIAIRLNNAAGSLYVSNIDNEWYGADSAAEGTVQAGIWNHFKVELNVLAETPCATIWLGETPIVTDWALIDGVTFDESIGFNLKARDDSGTTPVNVKIDNLIIYTESSADNAIKDLPNAAKADYFAKLITQKDITTGNYYELTDDLNLDNTALKEFNLEDMGVSVVWISSNPAVISNSGVVTQTDKNEYVEMTAAVTAGTGDDAVTVRKSFGYTVPAADSSIFSTYNYTFENDTLGEVPSDWTNISNAVVTTATHPERSGNVLEADFSSTACYARKKIVTEGSLNKRYFVSADVCFEPDAASTKMYFYLTSANTATRIGFDFQTGGISMSGENTEKFYMVPGVEAKTGEWYHIDIDFNVAKKNLMAYINGVAITAEPLDINDGIWSSYLYVRQVGLYSYGTGKAYLDNVIIRESNYDAPVYDENSDYTVRSITLTNQSGDTITNATEATTAVIANVKVIKNRTAEDGEAKVIFARYNESGKLEQLVSEVIDTAAPGYETNGQILKLTMPLESGNATDSFKIFVIDSDTITPIGKNYNSLAPKFDADKLLNMETNATPALELGYNAESKYDGIDAIIYDGDTYLGKETKHFAYIGLPEGASADNPVPAVVCVHGGGGSAYDEWVKRWNDKGYAAIAMNLNGRIPTPEITDGNSQLRHAWAGATQDNYKVVSPNDATWMYNAVAAVIGAHNVLREMPEVDNSKIGITGVSWGGVVTSTTIGVDDRFVFAIPAYGCGYLYGSETYMANAMTEEKKLWDPSNFIGKANIPILWMNGDKDGNFSLTSTTKSALLAGNNSYPCIIPNFAHSHSPVWERPEGYAFADSVVKGGTEFIRGNVTIAGTTATVKTNRAAKSAAMYYTTSETLAYLNGTSAQFSYSAVPNSASNTDTFTFEIPSGAKKLYVVFTDENGYSTSTVLYDVD